MSEAEAAAQRAEWARVMQLLGAGPHRSPFSFARPRGRLLTPDARALIAKGLGILGSACVHLGQIEQAEEVLRIGIQYAQEGVAAADLFRRLGEALLKNDRPGEAIGSAAAGPRLRRVARAGQLPLARAFLKRKKWVAAYACLRDALQAGVGERELVAELHEAETALGLPLTSWKAAVVTLGTLGKS